jgi:hypothetical protein
MTMNAQHVTEEGAGPLPPPVATTTKVQEKVRWWVSDLAHQNEVWFTSKDFAFRESDLWFTSKAFAFCVRNHPDHPAFDSLENEGVTRDEIVQALKELSEGCRWDYDRGGYGLVVYVEEDEIYCFYDPVPLIIGTNRALLTYNKLAQRRIKKIAVKVLKEGRKHLINTRLMDMEALCRIQYQLWRCKKKINNIGSRKKR